MGVSMDYDLQMNLDMVHTTELGIMRIKRNLNLTCEDVVAWCRQKIGDSMNVTRQGKNWYVRIDDVEITVNAHSFTIITAHVIKSDFDQCIRPKN